MRMVTCLIVLSACHRTDDVPKEIAIRPAEGIVVARVGHVTLTAEVLRARMAAQGGVERYRDPKELRQFVDQQVRFELLAIEALRQGLDRDPDVQEAARRTMVEKLIDRQLTSPDAVDDEAVQREYDRAIGDYRQPERAQAAIIKLKSLADAQGALRSLQNGKSDAMTFAGLRKHYGAEEMNRDLELKYWSEEELKASYGAELAKAIFSVQQLGEVGPVTRSAKGFYVFKLTGRRAAFHRPLADVTGTIKKKLAQRRRNDEFEAYVDRLRGETEVSVDERALGEVTKEP